MQLITYELKYCERCGMIGLRRTGTQDEYCERCHAALQYFGLAPQGRSKNKSNINLESSSQVSAAQLTLQDPAVPAGRVQ